jgi:hypothetical protein
MRIPADASRWTDWFQAVDMVRENALLERREESRLANRRLDESVTRRYLG